MFDVEPPIQYAKTSDGISVAYWVMGEGVPLVIPPILAGSHLQLEWEVEYRRGLFQGLAQRARVIHYDCRGIGLSQRDVIDFSPEAASRDLEAVTNKLGLSCFALYSSDAMGDVAFHYAATRPSQVSHLVHRTMPRRRGESAADNPVIRQREAMRSLADTEWELYTEVWARLTLGWNDAYASALAALIRASHSPESFFLATDVRQRSPDRYLGSIQVPALILHDIGDSKSEDEARFLASGIANAQLIAIPAEPTRALNVGEVGNKAILDFINAPATESKRAALPQYDLSAVRTILWTDIVGHTEMMQRLGDSRGRDVLREHEQITRDLLERHQGAELKAMGDGFMASFGSVTKALECAIGLQRAFDARSDATDEPLHVRVGLNAGEPIEEEGDLFGGSVILAARVAAQAGPGEILIPEPVRHLLTGKDFVFSDRGEFLPKGFDDAVRLYEVRWRGE